MDDNYQEYDSWKFNEWTLNEIAKDPLKDCFKSSQKSDEEIKKFLLPENLDELQKTILIITKGQNIQKFAIYKNLWKTWQDFPSKEIISLILEKIQEEDIELQLESVKGLTKLLQNNSLDRVLLISIFRKAISLLHISNPSLQKELLNLLHVVLSTINYDLLEKECEQNALLLSEKSQPKFNKIAAIRLIAHISEKAKHNFSTILNDRIRSLSQDQEKEIRRVIAGEVLPKLCKNVKQDFLEYFLLDKIVELIYDSDPLVKSLAIELIISNLNLFTGDTKKTRLMNLCLELLNSLNEEVIKKTSFYFGKIINDLDQVIKETPSFMNTFFMSYKEFSLHKNSEIRLNFIYNLPAVLEIFGIKFFEMIKSNYLNIFSNDNSQDARLCCIAILPTIIKMISVEEAHKTFAEGFCEYLLNIDDKNEIELLKKTLKILPKILEGLFSRKNYEDNESSRHFFEEILEILIRLQKKFESSNKWRLQFTLLQIFEDIKILECFSMNQLNDKYSPMLINTMKIGNSEIRKLACSNLVKFLQINYNSKKRNEIIKLLYDNFMKSKSYQKRLVYLEFCFHCFQIFPFNFLKLYIIPDCFELMNDRVANIRIKLCKLLPEIRNYIFTSDNETISKFTKVLSKLLEDKDIDVSDKAKWAKTEINKKNYNNAEIIKFMENINIKRKMEEEKLDALEKKEKEESRKKKNDEIENTVQTKSDNKSRIKINMYGIKSSSQPKIKKKKL